MFSVLCIILAVSSICCSASALTSTEKERLYNATITQLEAYLTDYKNDSSELRFIYDSFDELRGYEQSKFLGYYVTVLIKITENEYDYEMQALLNMIERNKDFDDYLSGNLKGSPIGTVKDIMAYADAREFEFDGNNDKAIEYYENCLSFFDASERYYVLVQSSDEKIYNAACELLRSAKKGETKKLEEAYFLFSTIERYNDSRDFMQSIVNILGYTPSKDKTLPHEDLITTTPIPTTETGLALNVSTSIGVNSLSWNSITGAKSYTIQRHRTNESYAVLDTVQQTSYKDTKVSGGFRYYYKIIANLSNGTTIISNEEIVITPSEKQTATPAPQKVTEYRYRDSYTAYSDWSSWSGWSANRESVSDSNLKQEDSRLQYGWWAAQCTNCGQNNPYHGRESKCYNCGRILRNDEGLWKSVFAFTDDVSGTQSIFGRSNGRYINGVPYWRASDNDRTQYRYRTRTVSTEWGSWSSWSTTKPESRSNRQIETRTVTK